MTDPLRRLHEPTGLGIYLRDIKREIHGTPAEAAEHALRHAVSWVAILGCWEEHRSNAFDLDDYGHAFRDAGIAVWVWGYPRAGTEETFAAIMREAAAAAGAVGLLLDPELPYKGQSDAAHELCSEVIDVLDERLGLGITSFGLPQAHPTFPWRTFGGVGWGSPQFYTVNPEVARKGAAAWRDHGWEHLVPSLPAFGQGAMDRLTEYVDALKPPGAIVWDWSAISSSEWRVLREVAGRLRAG